MFKLGPTAGRGASLRLLLGCACLVASACSDGRVQCLGEPVACERRTAAQCSDGCSPIRGCLGGEIACDSLTSQGGQLCNQTPGCGWRVECAGVREATDAACQLLSGNECVQQPDCQLSQACFGVGTACGTLEDDQCELYAQCTFGAACSGRAMDCGTMDSLSACDEAPGCFVADTRPASID